MNIKRLIIFVSIILICILSIGVGVYAQYMSRYNNASDVFFGNVLDLSEQKNQIYEELKNEFSNIFTNKLESEIYGVNINKINENNDLVYTSYEYSNNFSNRYTIGANIPSININSLYAKEINEDINKTFKDQIDKIESTSGKHISYYVDYVAYVNSDILSLVIRVNMKEAEKPQRTMIQTYNYSLTTDKKITIQDLLYIKNIGLSEANNKIVKEIKKVDDAAKALQELMDMVVYTRDLQSNIYQVDNVYNYFLGKDQYLYLVYAYGNKELTNTTDLIIF